MAIRIWHQSLTDLTLLPGYAAMLAEHARRICGAETVVELHGLRPGTYPAGMAPIDMPRWRWAHRLGSIQIVENIIRAEREGYDAVAISCFLDPGLEEARSLVDIPVVSSLETALLVSSSVGRAFGLLTIDEAMAVMLRELVRQYGFSERVRCVEALDPPITEYDLDAAFAGSPDFARRFSAQASRLVDRGADVIIPAEGVVNTVLVRNEVQEVAGAPVLDSYGALLAFAEMTVQLRRRAGLRVARRGVYARPAAPVVDHLRDVTAAALADAARRVGR
jgi:Asp/Glu/hydantoin racemase